MLGCPSSGVEGVFWGGPPFWGAQCGRAGGHCCPMSLVLPLCEEFGVPGWGLGSPPGAGVPGIWGVRWAGEGD